MSVVNLPPATGGGADYTVANASGATVTVTADTTGTPDTIDGAVDYDLFDDESITVMDYKADNWVII